jgi:hypothetical protein
LQCEKRRIRFQVSGERPFDCIGRLSMVETLRVDVRHHARMSNGSEGKDVLSSLPRSRPQRRSAKREGAKAKASAAPKPVTQSPAADAQDPKRGKPKAPPKPKQKVSGATRPSAATRRAREDSVKPRPAPPPPPERDVVGTALEAAGELARIGLTVGTQIVREATRRIPRP